MPYKGDIFSTNLICVQFQHFLQRGWIVGSLQWSRDYKKGLRMKQNLLGLMGHEWSPKTLHRHYRGDIYGLQF